MFCRTECGYAGVRDVEDCSLDEQMPSFFLSETLKYLYLLFDEVGRLLFFRSRGILFSCICYGLPVGVFLALVPVSSWGVKSADSLIVANPYFHFADCFFAPG